MINNMLDVFLGMATIFVAIIGLFIAFGRIKTTIDIRRYKSLLIVLGILGFICGITMIVFAANKIY